MYQKTKHKNNPLSYSSVIGSLLFFGFWLFGIFSIFHIWGFNREYQDSWIGEDIWLWILGLLLIYIIKYLWGSSVDRMVWMAAGILFFFNLLPAIKYHLIYGNAIDQAHHLSLIRHLQSQGVIEPDSIYQDSPGFHVATALLGTYAGLSPVLVSKIISAFLGCFIPFSYYLFCKNTECPADLARLILWFSGLSAPLLYFLNGSTFTSPIYIFIVLLIVTREHERLSANKNLGFTIIIMLAMITIIIWHPSTTLVLIISLVLASIISFILNKFHSGNSRWSQKPQQLGIILSIVAFSYWMYRADVIWGQFIRNLQLILENELTPEIIPNSLYQLDFLDQAMIGMLYHGRDFIFFGLAVIGFILLFSPGANTGEPSNAFRLLSLIWLSTVIILLLIIISGYGEQGYMRFLFFTISLSPFLAGYAFWRVKKVMDIYVNRSGILVLSMSAFLLVSIGSLFQILTPQFLVPDYISSSSTAENVTTVRWFHQVNSIYQYQMIDYAINKLHPSHQMITDYVTHNQVYQFFGREKYYQVVYFPNQKTEPAYILLHWPGVAGGFNEQAQYRTVGNIYDWKNFRGVSTIYDNGGSFILYHPDNDIQPFLLSERDHE